ncbi:MAG: hypothetical protein LBG31_05940 [Prevotellaceae bacterium]|jgi:uncharacterized protein (TIGR02145 family)|nr:hypothetical protein [Prevotellaceae bacterium]
MKKILFLFALLASITASATVTVTPLSVDYSNKKVTFRVSWTNSPAAPYNNRVWVWVDLCPITGTSPGTFAQAVISGATATAGNILTVSNNTRGFYVTTNPSTVTATLSNATGKFNWCVYGSDAPPKVTANNGTYTLYGTPPFTLTAANGTTTQTVAANAIATSAVTITPVTLTDRTGYPGVFCIYTGSDLYIDATHLCQQRTSGAKNWEAHIKDSRDSRLYRIVLMPDQKWYMAQNLNYRGVTYYCYGNNSSNCNETNGVWYQNPPVTSTLCPSGWSLPSCQNWTNLISNYNMTNATLKSTTCSGVDTYGMRAMCVGLYSSNVGGWIYQGQCDRWIVPATYQSALHIYNYGSYTITCECSHGGCTSNTDYDTVRCFRQL